MTHRVLLLLAVAGAHVGCDRVFDLTRPPSDASEDAMSSLDAIDAPLPRCDFAAAGTPVILQPKGLSIAAGQFGEDDAIDLVVGQTGLTQLTFLYNNNLDFSSVYLFEIGGTALSLAVRDLDHAGFDDVAFTTATSAGAVIRSASSWMLRDVALIGGPARSVSVANFDGVGLDDLLVTLPSGNAIQRVLGDTGYVRGSTIPTTSSVPVDAIAMNIDGDADLDVVAALESRDAIGIYRDTGANFDGGMLLGTGMKPVAVAAARLGDRLTDDLLVVNEAMDTVSVVRNAGGVFTVDVDLPVGDSPRAIVAADVNEDGFTDVLVVNNKSNTLTLLRGTATSFEIAQQYATVEKPIALAVADFTGDDHLDVAVLGEDAGFVIHRAVCASP